MANNRLMAVKISDGLFPSERTVQFNTEEGDVSVFVSSNQLDGGRLKVTLLDQDNSHALVQVPSQGGTTVAKVKLTAIITSAT